MGRNLSIAIVGNCQIPPLASILRMMLPAHEIRTFPLPKLRERRDQARAARQLPQFDIVLTQPLTDAATHGPLRSGNTKARNSGTVLFPAIVFDGFHPDFFDDQTCMTRAGGYYHSTIVAACFVNRVPLQDVHRYITAFTAARLGYFCGYAASRDFLLKEATECGFDLSEAFARWETSGVFMHTPNHPAIHTLIDLARMIVSKLGMSTARALVPLIEKLDTATEEARRYAADLDATVRSAYTPSSPPYFEAMRHQEIRAHFKSLSKEQKLNLLENAPKRKTTLIHCALCAGRKPSSPECPRRFSSTTESGL